LGSSYCCLTMRYLFSFYADAAKIALQSILAHKLRAFLTLIGIIIGVAAVVVVGASVSGLNTYVTERVAKLLGANHFMMARVASTKRLSDDEFERMNRRNKRLNWDDYEWVKEHCKDCSEVGAEVGSQVDLAQDGIEFPGCIVFGVTANMSEIEDKTIVEGRFISNDEVERSALVCVLGGDIKDKYFPNTDAIGQTLKVRGLPMRVVGVEEKRGAFLAIHWIVTFIFRPRRTCRSLGVTVYRSTARRRRARTFNRRSKRRGSRCGISID